MESSIGRSGGRVRRLLTIPATIAVVGMSLSSVTLLTSHMVGAQPPAPMITRISPTSGPSAGGTRVTVTGHDLTGPVGVLFGSTAAASYSVNQRGTKLTAISPAESPGAVPIVVTTAGGSSSPDAGDEFTFGSLRLRDVVRLATDESGDCALLGSGRVSCWGQNSQGQLGDGSIHDTARPVAVTGIRSAVGLASDSAGYCAVLSSGSVECWGANLYGDLGDGTSSGPHLCGGEACSTTPVLVNGITTAKSVTSVGNNQGSGVGFSYCAVLTSGAVECWGLNYVGELGDGTSNGPDTCGGATPCSTSPVAVGGISTAVSVVSGGTISYCAVLSSGGVACWGDDGSDALGSTTGLSTCSHYTYPNEPCATSPVTVSGVGGIGTLSGVTGVASDGYGYCAWLTVGGVDCWGAAVSGSLGDGTLSGPDSCVEGATCSALPVVVSGVGGSGTLAGIATMVGGDESYCALASGGGVDCWGYAIDGQLGDGATTDADVPMAVTGITTAASLGTNTALSYCAALTSGSVDCWGYNQGHELGNASNVTQSDVPVAALVSGVVGIFGGGDAYCALLVTFRVTCWGEDGL